MSSTPDPTFDLNISGLRTSLRQAAGFYSADEVRELVCAIFTGRNYRELTERPTRQTISVFAAWLLNVAHRSLIRYGTNWSSELLQLSSRRGASQEERWLRFWLLGLTQKTATNLGLSAQAHPDYQRRVQASVHEAIQHLEWAPTSIGLTTEDLSPASLTPADSVWLMQVAGAAALTIRGSKKSFAGKRLEKAIARAALAGLGLREGEHFRLNVERDQEVEREVDAEVQTRRGYVRMDIALIGTGNQEVSEDKLARVGRHGVVLVDKLGPRSRVLQNAARHEVKVIQLRNNFALTDLFAHLQPLVPQRVSLRPPPADERRLVSLFRRMPSSTYALPVPG